MANQNFEKSAEALADLIRTMGSPEKVRSMFQLLGVLLDGEPVSPEQAAIRLRVSHEEALTLFKQLREMGAEFDEQGNFMGLGLTLIPTSHRYEVDGRTFYTWCAEDGIFFPAIFGHRATIESRDPVTGESIRLVVTPDNVERVEPGTAVVSRRFTGGDGKKPRGTVCDFGHLFVSPDTAADYLRIHEGLDLEIVAPDQSFKIAQMALEQASLGDLIS